MQKFHQIPANDTKIILDWCKTIKLEREIFGGKPTCRLKKWWGYEAEFWIDRSYIYEREAIAGNLKRMANCLHPGCNSILLYRYEVGGEIGKHLDKKCFSSDVTMINLIDGPTDMYGEMGTTRFKWGDKMFFLSNGGIYKFNSRVFHSVPSLKIRRYSLQFRTVLV
jgi:hypothetical protein